MQESVVQQSVMQQAVIQESVMQELVIQESVMQPCMKLKKYQMACAIRETPM